MADRRYHVVFNPNSGTSLSLGLTAEILAGRLEANGITATIDDDDDQPMEDRVARAIAGDADVIVAAGGDGTVVAVAEAIVGTDKILGILPLGTMNAMARDVSIPLDLDQAVASLATSEVHKVDVGEVNGRIFLENVTIGVMAPLTAVREKIRGKGILAWLSFMGHVVTRLSQGRRIAMEITAEDGRSRIERLRAINVANGPYSEAPGQLLTRAWINDGLLTLYKFKRLTARDAFRLAAEMMIGRWTHDDAIEIETARSVTIRVRKETVAVALDGEVVKLDVPMTFSKRPLALAMLLPVPPADPVPLEQTVGA